MRVWIDRNGFIQIAVDSELEAFAMQKITSDPNWQEKVVVDMEPRDRLTATQGSLAGSYWGGLAATKLP